MDNVFDNVCLHECSTVTAMKCTYLLDIVSVPISVSDIQYKLGKKNQPKKNNGRYGEGDGGTGNTGF